MIGLDVSMTQLATFGLTNETEIIKKLISSAPCHSSNLTECQIDALRETSCGISGCSNAGSIQECANPPDNIFLDPV